MNATVTGRKDTVWFSICTKKIFEVKKGEAYPACSYCLNRLPNTFTICPICSFILTTSSMFCTECLNNSEAKNKQKTEERKELKILQ
ncbi:hypothetical protein NEFER02_0015 [Nematocida sp. LUAm2]|nr:hypothetical protein NEFER02_0015 [Nematocida sp. LUAm2]